MASRSKKRKALQDYNTTKQVSKPMTIMDVDADGKPYPKSEQVARCGNAVCPPIPTALVRANLPELCEMKEAG